MIGIKNSIVKYINDNLIMLISCNH